MTHIDLDTRTDNADLTLAELIQTVVDYRRRIALCALSFLILALGWLVVTPRTYTVRSQLSPVDGGQQAAGRLGLLAAQFGVAGMMPAGGVSPDYLVDVILSREMIAALVDHQYTAVMPSRLPFGLGGGRQLTGSLLLFYDLDTTEAKLDVSREMAIEALREDLSARSRLESGVVSVSVRTRSPDLSVAVLQLLIDRLEEFNHSVRQSQARAEREFVEARLESAGNELTAAEQELARFLEHNRSFDGSPALRFKYESLMREVSLRHEVVRTLAQANEQARIEEVRATPVVTIVSAPEAPALPDRRYGALKLIAALVVGLVVGLTSSLVSSLLEKERQSIRAPEYGRVSLRNIIASDIRAVRSWFSRRRRLT